MLRDFLKRTVILPDHLNIVIFLSSWIMPLKEKREEAFELRLDAPQSFSRPALCKLAIELGGPHRVLLGYRMGRGWSRKLPRKWILVLSENMGEIARGQAFQEKEAKAQRWVSPWSIPPLPPPHPRLWGFHTAFILTRNKAFLSVRNSSLSLCVSLFICVFVFVSPFGS